MKSLTPKQRFQNEKKDSDARREEKIPLELKIYISESLM